MVGLRVRRPTTTHTVRRVTLRLGDSRVVGPEGCLPQLRSAEKRRLLSWWRHEARSVKAALAATHHSAPRRPGHGWRRRHSSCTMRKTLAMAAKSGRAAGAARGGQRHTAEQVADFVPTVQILDVPVPQWRRTGCKTASCSGLWSKSRRMTQTVVSQSFFQQHFGEHIRVGATGTTTPGMTSTAGTTGLQGLAGFKSASWSSLWCWS